MSVVCQLRRWLPLCKLLGKRLLMKHPMAYTQEMENAHDSATRANLRWMNKRGCIVLTMIKEWVKVSSCHTYRAMLPPLMRLLSRMASRRTASSRS
jgi:hypothetical protein